MTIDPIYSYVNSFYNERALVEFKNRYSYIDKNGKIIIDGDFIMGSDFSQNLASVRKDNKWGYIVKNGKLVSDYLYDKAKSFKEDLAPVCINNKWGYIDKSPIPLGEISFFYIYSS